MEHASRQGWASGGYQCEVSLSAVVVVEATWMLYQSRMFGQAMSFAGGGEACMVEVDSSVHDGDIIQPLELASFALVRNAQLRS